MSKPSASRYIAGISWPRSGHHLLQRLVQSYFKELGYCPFYGGRADCCGRVPCTNPGVRFSKNHDFKGEVVPQDGTPYLIQYRSLIPSIISDWELYLRNGNADEAALFEKFARHKVGAWADFVKKWVDSPAGGWERLVVLYDDLVASPEMQMERVARFFSPELAPDAALIRHVVSSVAAQNVTKDSETWEKNAGVKESRKVPDFRYYNPELFAELDALSGQLRTGSKAA